MDGCENGHGFAERSTAEVLARSYPSDSNSNSDGDGGLFAVNPSLSRILNISGIVYFVPNEGVTFFRANPRLNCPIAASRSVQANEKGSLSTLRAVRGVIQRLMSGKKDDSSFTRKMQSEPNTETLSRDPLFVAMSLGRTHLTG